MRRGINLLFFFIAIFSFAQSGIQFSEGSFSQLLEKAEKENKLVFVDAYAVWCGPCKLMEKNVFPTTIVGDYFNENFINARIDMEKGEGKQLALQYEVSTFPHYLFINSLGELVHRGYGYLEAERLVALGQEAVKKKEGGSIVERFNQGERDLSFLMEASKVYLNSNPEFSRQASEAYFEEKTSTGYTHDEIALLLYFVSSSEDKNFTVLKRDKEEIIKLLPVDIYESFVQKIELNSIAMESMIEQEGKIDEAYFLEKATQMLGEEKAQEELLRFEVNYFPTVDNFKDYEKAALLYYGSGEGFESIDLDRAVYLFVEHIESPESLERAALWSKESIEISPSYENYYLAGLLHQKLGQKEKALEFAKESFRLLKEVGKDPDLAQTLIDSLEK